MHHRLAIVAALAVIVQLPASAQPSDTTAVSVDPVFVPKDLVYAGAFMLGTAISWPIDRYVAERLQRPWTQENRILRETAVVVRRIAYPGAFIIGGGLYAAGRLGGNDRMADLGLHGTEALLIGAGVATVIKYVAGRQRPFVDIETPYSFQTGRGFEGEQFRSFPSGHTVAGFAAAAAVVTETKRWWPKAQWAIAPAMYGGAALVGISRIYDNKHWASDVMMGAFIGSFAGRKIVRYHHSHPSNRIDEWLLSGSISPNQSGGYSLRWAILPR